MTLWLSGQGGLDEQTLQLHTDSWIPWKSEETRLHRAALCPPPPPTSAHTRESCVYTQTVLRTTDVALTQLITYNGPKLQGRNA